MAGLLQFLSPILSGVAGAVAVSWLAKLGLRSSPDRNGWHRIAPSAAHWLGLAGSAAFASLVLYIRLFVGSARADAAEQMFWAEVLVAGFGLGSLVSLWQIRRIRRADVFWRGSTLCYVDAGGRERVRPMTDIAAIDGLWTGTVVLTFGDGEALRLDHHAQGVPELCERIDEVLTV